MGNRVQKSSFSRGVLPKDRVVAILQNNVDEGFRNQFKNTPFSNGALLLDNSNKEDPTAIKFKSGALTIELPHRLDGEAKGFIVVDSNNDVRFFRNVLSGGRKSTHVSLTATAICQARFWIWR